MRHANFLVFHRFFDCHTERRCSSEITLSKASQEKNPYAGDVRPAEPSRTCHVCRWRVLIAVANEYRPLSE
jgi:hypothetical protein